MRRRALGTGDVQTREHKPHSTLRSSRESNHKKVKDVRSGIFLALVVVVVVVVVAVIQTIVLSWKKPQELIHSPHRSHVVIVIPFIRSQVKELQESLALWNLFPPCRSRGEVERLGRLGLVFHFNRNLSEPHEQGIRLAVAFAWHALNASVRACFAETEPSFISANLADDEDAYPVGPCFQHWKTFDVLRNWTHDASVMMFDHWFQFEPDVTPIQRGWGSELVRLASANKDCFEWWQLGSLPLGDNILGDFVVRGRYITDHHLNGNALYCLRSSEYDDYRKLVRKNNPPMGCFAKTDRGPIVGFDAASYVYRADPRRSRAYMHRFRASEFVLNYGERVSEVLVNSRDCSALVRRHPRSFLVHSKLRLVEFSTMRRRVWTCNALGCSWVTILTNSNATVTDGE